MNCADVTPEEMADLLKEIDFGDPVVAKKANALWKMLDRLAEKSPTEYQKFISQQLRQGRELSAFVRPWFCLRTELLEGRAAEKKGDDDGDDEEAERRRRRRRAASAPRYINFCTSDGVKPPEGETVPIVMSKERRHYDDDEDDVGYFVVDAVFSSEVKARAEKDNLYLDDVTKLALDCVEEALRIKLRKRGYKLFLEGAEAAAAAPSPPPPKHRDRRPYKGPFAWTRAGKEASHPERPPRRPEDMTPSALLAAVKKEEEEEEEKRTGTAGGPGRAGRGGEIRTKAHVAVRIPGAPMQPASASGRRLAGPLIQEIG